MLKWISHSWTRVQESDNGTLARTVGRARGRRSGAEGEAGLLGVAAVHGGLVDGIADLGWEAEDAEGPGEFFEGSPEP